MQIDLISPIDNKDDRREIYYILDTKMSHEERRNFLVWAVDKVNKGIPLWGKVAITSNTGHTAETYYDLMLLISLRNLDLKTVLDELERRGHRPKLPCGF